MIIVSKKLLASLILLCLSNLSFVTSMSLVKLKAKTSITGVDRKEVQNFLSTPSNWPKIVLSSHSVKPVQGNDINIEEPLSIGDSIDEVFGLPPILPLSVTWECVANDENTGSIEFFSSSGLPLIANECRMKFKLTESKRSLDDIVVNFEMEYNPKSFIAILASPLLSLDNSFAIRVLLPNVITRAQRGS